MCGIAGSIGLNNKNSIEILENFSHRGPDENGTYIENGISFYHNRLSILDVKSAHQPMISDDKNVVLTYNGEIYNFLELKKEFLQDYNFNTSSDTEVILALYLKYGFDFMIEQIEGMFAFSIYDKSKKLIYIVRDRLGEKPLYYTSIDNKFIFSSEIKTILELSESKFKINKNLLFEYFIRSKIDGKFTIIENIFELEAASYIKYDLNNNNHEINKYWHIENTFDNKITDTTEEEVLSNIDILLTSSIKSRMISDVPVGILLSGGLDSSIMLERLSTIGEEPSIILTSSNEHIDIDESINASNLVKSLQNKNKLSSSINFIKMSTVLDKNIVSTLETLAYFYDEPLQFYNSINLSTLIEKSKKENTKVLLSGEGSDEIFFGYDRYVRLIKQDNFNIDDLYIGGAKDNISVIGKLLNETLNSTTYEKSESFKWLKDIRNKYGIADNILMFDQKFRLQTLLQRQDRIGMMHSVEMRVPFLNYKLVTYMNSLDNKYKYNEKTKYTLKKYATNKIPDEIIHQRKIGFENDFFIYLKKDFKNIKTYILESAHCIGFDPLVAGEILDVYFKSNKYEVLVWQMLSIVSWYNSYKKYLED